MALPFPKPSSKKNIINWMSLNDPIPSHCLDYLRDIACVLLHYLDIMYCHIFTILECAYFFDIVVHYSHFPPSVFFLLFHTMCVILLIVNYAPDICWYIMLTSYSNKSNTEMNQVGPKTQCRRYQIWKGFNNMSNSPLNIRSIIWCWRSAFLLQNDAEEVH